jgi:hypothetical protein
VLSTATQSLDNSNHLKQGQRSRSQRRREKDADEDYNYDSSATEQEFKKIRKSRKEADNGFVYDNGELGLDFNHFEGGLQSLMRFTKHLPGINCNLDPVINFKLKQKISHFGACITLGERELSQTIPHHAGNTLKMLLTLCVKHF